MTSIGFVGRGTMGQAMTRRALWASSAMLGRSLPRAAGQQFDSDGATIGGLSEIQRLVAALAEPADLPQFARAQATFSRGVEDGLAGLDPSALVLTYPGWPQR